MASLATVCSALRLVTTAAPRMYAAARNAGAGHREAATALQIAGTALVVTTRREPTKLGKQNALRHFVWQALLTARLGRAVAQALAGAHEAPSTDRADSAVDEVNNRLGQEFGDSHRAELRNGSLNQVASRLCEIGEQKWQSRELAAQPRADGTDPRD